MSPESPPPPISEIPHGEELLRTTVDLTRDALVESYPILGEAPFSSQLPSFHNTVFLSKDELRVWEEEEKPESENVIFQGLKLAGVPKNALDAVYYRSINNQALSNFSTGPNIYIDEAVRSRLDSGNPQLRSSGAFVIGQLLINQFLIDAPQTRPLPDYPWKKTTLNGIQNEFFATLQSKHKKVLDSEKMAKLRELLADIADTDDSKVVAKGARICLLIGGQNAFSAEASLGSTLNSGVLHYLGEDPATRLYDLMRTNSLIQRRVLDFKKTTQQKRLEEICKDSGLKMGKELEDKREFLEYYLQSLLPLYLFWERSTGNTLLYR